MRTKSRCFLFLLFGILAVEPIVSNTNVDEHIEKGKQFLALGKLPESLEHFTAVIDAEPNNYLHYFRRATIFLGMNRPLPALNDLSQSITLNPRFVGALVKRGTVQLSFGRFDSARSDYDQALALDSGNTEAQEKLRVLNEMSEAVSSGREAHASSDWETCVSQLSRAVETLPWDWALLETRSECNARRGDLEASHRDLRQMLRLMPASGAGEDSKRLFSTYLRLAQSVYDSGDTEQALRDLRECLKLDPEQSQCLKLHRSVKRTSKHLTAAEEAFGQQRWAECAKSARELLPQESSRSASSSSPSVPPLLVLKARSFLCRSLAKLPAESDSDAFAECSKLIDSDPKGPFAAEALCARGNMQLDSDKIDEAVDDFKRALEAEQDIQCAKEGRDRAEKIRKQRGKRDYYAILGVSKRATTREIERAYRKLAAKWHPDRFRSQSGATEADRKAAERKFIDIAAAKEVLTDPEKRRQYDQGVDPLDPEAQAQQGGGHPFQGGNFQFVFPAGFNPFGGGGGGGGGGFNPFGGGGGFKFHFGG